jgi:hypothetical protein
MRTKHLLAGLTAAVSMGGAVAAHADALSTPALGATLSANPNPVNFSAGPLGKIYVSGQVTGLGMLQDNPVPGDKHGRGDLSNAQIEVQKTDGVFQFFVQAGAYSLPTIGTPYVKGTDLPDLSYKWVPVAFVKLQPSANFNVMIGKLPTLIGAEGAFTYQNVNIERGLLWNQEPLFSRGVQLNFTQGNLSASVAWTDGYYSNVYSTGSLLVTYALSKTDTIGFDATGQFHKTGASRFTTPLVQNNGQLYNLMWTHTQGPWMIEPYLQLSNTPRILDLGITDSVTSLGGAVLAKYSFNSNFSLGARAEYIGSNGGTNILYGPGSRAWSLTLTPTYQIKQFFVRGEISYAKVNRLVPGFGFGDDGTADAQTRGLIEVGVLY